MNDPSEHEHALEVHGPGVPRPATPGEAARAHARNFRNRLVVIEQVYFQSTGQQPVASECRFERGLASDDSPYPPPRVVLNDGDSLLLASPARAGWLVDSEVGLFHVRNDGPGTVLVCHADGADTPLFRVRPGESFRAEPLDANKIVLRARGGPCTVKYTLFPA
jgi:hypothetical protein